MVIKMMNAQPTGTYIPPDVSTVKTLNKVTKIIALIFGIILIIVGAISLIALVGIVPLIFGVVDLIIYYEIKDIDSLIDQQRYNEAKSKTFVWMIIGFILSGILVGILLLIAWLKYDDIIRAVQQSYTQQGPVPPQPPVQ
jgi:fatty acid desaturase